MTKKEKALIVIERLKAAYPDATCTLDYTPEEAWKLLVGVRLAAQCTDERVNKITAVPRILVITMFHGRDRKSVV